MRVLLVPEAAMASSASDPTQHQAPQVLPDPDPTALPAWRPREPLNPECKCRPIEAHSLAGREGWEGARHFQAGEVIMSNRCRWHFRNPLGCKFGDACSMCHVHAWGKHEPDHSQVVPDPDSQHGARKLHRHERREKKAAETEEDKERKQAYASMVRAVRSDAGGFLDFGIAIGSVHLVIWSIHRLAEQARQTQAHVAEIFDLLPEHVGIWLGVDKLCAARDHYPLGPAEGVHTLMKGLATKLEILVQQSSADGFVIMESDCLLVDALRGKLDWLAGQCACHNFVWLGFHTNEQPNYHPDQRLKKRALGAISPPPGVWPMFKGKAEGKITPAYGCQMFWLHRDAIEGLCARLRAEPRPHGLDMYFWSPNFFPNSEVKFLSRSLAGQQPGYSDNWERINWAVGIMENCTLEEVFVRSFDEPGLRETRAKRWDSYLKRDAKPGDAKKV